MVRMYVRLSPITNTKTVTRRLKVTVILLTYTQGAFGSNLEQDTVDLTDVVDGSPQSQRACRDRTSIMEDSFLPNALQFIANYLTI
jgi:hypothetical protein